MRRITSVVATLAVLCATPLASAKSDPKAKKPQVLRVAHSYADAMAEAKDRKCLVFATFHADG